MNKLGTYELNKIYCEDSYKAIKNIPDKSIDLIYTDIPYLIKSGGCGKSDIAMRIQKQHANLGSKKNKEFLDKKIAEFQVKMNNASSPEEYEKWRVMKNNAQRNLNLIEVSIVDGIDYSILDEFVRVLKHIYIYIWCSKEQIHDLMSYFIDKHNCNFNLLVWCKTNPTPSCNNNWLSDLEYCLVFKDKNAPRYNDGYENKSKWYATPLNVYDKKLYDHPTIKPLELVKRHLLHSTNENDIVADFFSGSGTTCVACKELNRRFIGFEIDSKFHKSSVDRLNGVDKTGQTSLLDTDFEQLSLLDEESEKLTPPIPKNEK